MARYWIRLEGADNITFATNLIFVEIPIFGIQYNPEAETNSKQNLQGGRISRTRFRDSFTLVIENASTHEIGKYNTTDLIKIRNVLQKPFIRLRRCSDFGGTKQAPPRWENPAFTETYNLLPVLVCDGEITIETAWASGTEKATVTVKARNPNI